MCRIAKYYTVNISNSILVLLLNVTNQIEKSNCFMGDGKENLFIFMKSIYRAVMCNSNHCKCGLVKVKPNECKAQNAKFVRLIGGVRKL